MSGSAAPRVGAVPRRSCLLPLLLAAWPLLAPQGLEGQTQRVVGFTLENDGLAVWRSRPERSDWYYTHGARLEWTGTWLPPGSGRLGLRDLPVCGNGLTDAPCRRSRFALTQRIFTPKALFTHLPLVPPELSDRPYAGWLSLSVAVERVSVRRSTRYAVELGVTGDASFGRQLHLAIHDWFDKAPPQGWDQQIPFEPAGALSARHALRVGRLGDGSGLSAVLEPSVALTLGTLRTSGEVGATFHLGWNALPDAPWSGDGRVLISLGLGGEAVARDLFLDGSLWRKTARTEREPIVLTSQLRLLLGWRSLNLRLGATRTSPTFTLQDEPHVFGTFGVSLRLAPEEEGR